MKDSNILPMLAYLIFRFVEERQLRRKKREILPKKKMIVASYFQQFSFLYKNG